MRRHRTHPRRREVVLASLVAIALTGGALVGCGGSDSDSGSEAIEARIDRERADAATDARQEQKLKDLKAEVEQLRHERRLGKTVVQQQQRSPVPVDQAAAAPGSSSRTFHAPSGNVSCRVDGSSASCSVAAIATTFVLPPSGEAYVEEGMALVRASGAQVDWGTSVTVGSITCRVPREDEPSGITCVDGDTGHGFEASRVSSRQKAY